MQAGQWQLVPGTESIQVYPYIRKPDVLSSNSYVLRFPQGLVVIDPGGDLDQTQTLVSVAREAMPAAGQMDILLTHCHVDHTLETVRNDLWRSFPSVRVMIQANGAQALKAGDRRLTQAEILGCDLPPFRTDVALFKSSGGQTDRARLVPGATEWIRPGGSETIEVYYTPGHSPDGVCFRVGEMLFAGDLLAAVSPLVAGAPGWEFDALLSSLKAMLQLVETGRIRVCGVGHGNLLAGDGIAAGFRHALEEASSLNRIETADAARVRVVCQSAQELCEDLSALFYTIHRTIERVAANLHALEEFSAADEVRRILQSDQVAELIAEFRNFREGLLIGQHIEVQVALKGVQVVGRISRLLEYHKLARIIDPALVSLARFSLGDFLQAAKGLLIEEPREEVELNALADGLVGELSVQPGAVPLDDVPDDPAGFTEYLVGNIALASARTAVSWKASPLEEKAKVLVPSSRFHVTVKCLLMDLAEAGAKEITVSPARDSNGLSLLIRAEFGQPLFVFGESQVSPYRRRFRLAGLRLLTRFLATGLVMTLPFNDPPLSISNR